MTRDIVRTVCAIIVMAVACSLIIETRFHLACIDNAQRQACQPTAFLPTPPPEPGRLRAVGRAILDLADAGLAVVR
jgi:hypothetical protein